MMNQQLVNAVIVASSAALAHGLFASAFHLLEGRGEEVSKFGRFRGRVGCPAANDSRFMCTGQDPSRQPLLRQRSRRGGGRTLRLRHGSQENALFLVAFTVDIAQDASWRRAGRVR